MPFTVERLFHLMRDRKRFVKDQVPCRRRYAMKPGVSPVDTDGMALGVGDNDGIRIILDKALQHGPLLLELRLHLALLHRLAHGVGDLLHLREVGRVLDEAVGDTGLEDSPGHLLIPLPCVEDDGHGRVIFADSGKEVEAVVAGEVIVEDQNVDSPAGEVVEEAGTAREGDDRELIAVGGAEEVQEPPVVIEVKNRYSSLFFVILRGSSGFFGVPSLHRVFLLLPLHASWYVPRNILRFLSNHLSRDVPAPGRPHRTHGPHREPRGCENGGRLR